MPDKTHLKQSDGWPCAICTARLSRCMAVRTARCLLGMVKLECRFWGQSCWCPMGSTAWWSKWRGGWTSRCSKGSPARSGWRMASVSPQISRQCPITRSSPQRPTSCAGFLEAVFLHRAPRRLPGGTPIPSPGAATASTQLALGHGNGVRWQCRNRTDCYGWQAKPHRHSFTKPCTVRGLMALAIAG